MKNGVKAVGWIVLLGACGTAAALFLGGRHRAHQASTDPAALRVELREQVAKGRLTEAQARVKLAEAYAASKQQERGRAEVKLTPELEALGADLKEKVEKGELSPGEAKARWWEAVKVSQVRAKGAETNLQNSTEVAGD